MDLWVIIIIVVIIIVIIILLLCLYLCGLCGKGKVKTTHKPKTPENYFLSPDLWKSPSLELALKKDKLAQKSNQNTNIQTKDEENPKSSQKSITTTRSELTSEQTINDQKNASDDNKA